jgi:hypothetical protein
MKSYKKSEFFVFFLIQLAMHRLKKIDDLTSMVNFFEFCRIRKFGEGSRYIEI